MEIQSCEIPPKEMIKFLLNHFSVSNFQYLNRDAVLRRVEPAQKKRYKCRQQRWRARLTQVLWYWDRVRGFGVCSVGFHLGFNVVFPYCGSIPSISYRNVNLVFLWIGICNLSLVFRLKLQLRDFRHSAFEHFLKP